VEHHGNRAVLAKGGELGEVSGVVVEVEQRGLHEWQGGEWEQLEQGGGVVDLENGEVVDPEDGGVVDPEAGGVEDHERLVLLEVVAWHVGLEIFVLEVPSALLAPQGRSEKRQQPRVPQVAALVVAELLEQIQMLMVEEDFGLQGLSEEL